MKKISIWLPKLYIEKLDELVNEGVYAYRSAAIRHLIRDELKQHHKIE